MAASTIGIDGLLIGGIIVTASAALFPRAFAKLYPKRNQEFFEKFYSSWAKRIGYGCAAAVMLWMLIASLTTHPSAK